MSYGGVPYAGGPYAGALMDAGDIPVDHSPTLSVEVAFTTGALEAPVWVDVTTDVRRWDTTRGRRRELERFQPGRATIVLSNRDRQYDSVNAAGPHFGNVRPGRRIRIRETFNGVTYPVFDGHVDRWHLDYPGKGKDATATVTATDASKLFARTDLPRSVYTHEVEADNPVLWWRLDEGIDKFREGLALNAGLGGSTRDGSFVASPKMGDQGLIVNDGGTAMTGVSLNVDRPAILKQGVFLANAALDVLANTAFSVEAWTRMDLAGNALGFVWFVGIGATDDSHAFGQYVDDTGDGSTGRFRFLAVNTGGSIYGVDTPDGSVLPGVLYHVVWVVETSGQMAIYLDGVRHVGAVTGVAGSSLSGVARRTGGALSVGYDPRVANTAAWNFHGTIDELAIYPVDLGSTRINVHYAAGTHPWQGDTPKERADRVLDLVGYSSALRELDDSASAATFQSAEIGHPALEHLQKIGETEFGLLFVTRDGTVRLVDRATQAVRVPEPAVFGDASDEVGYTVFVPDDGDDVIRNQATISRLNGVAKVGTVVTSIEEFGRFDYTLDGLLHDTDAYSQDYADWVVDEYRDPRRRITTLGLGPPASGDEATLYPEMLGREIGEAVVVCNRPLGGGALFEQTCVIEGVDHQWTPGHRTTRWVLSPEFTEALF